MSGTMQHARRRAGGLARATQGTLRVRAQSRANRRETRSPAYSFARGFHLAGSFFMPWTFSSISIGLSDFGNTKMPNG